MCEDRLALIEKAVEAKPLTYKNSYRVSVGILRNFTEFYGILRNFTEFYGILQNFTEFNQCYFSVVPSAQEPVCYSSVAPSVQGPFCYSSLAPSGQ